MKIVTIDKSLMLKYAGDPEILQKDNHTCVLIVRLKYKGKNHDKDEQKSKGHKKGEQEL